MINPPSRNPHDFQERGADHFKFLRPSRFVVVDDNHDAIVAERMGLKGSLTGHLTSPIFYPSAYHERYRARSRTLLQRRSG